MLTVSATQAKMQLMLSLSYLSELEKRHIAQACEYADQAHSTQTRKSGEPYILHPIAVAQILSSLQVDGDSIAAALLHDVIEDTPVERDEIAQLFGDKVAELVDGVTKLKSSHDNRSDKIASLRKILIATLNEPRVIIIKLADRLHNMSTLDALRADKRARIAKETLDIFIPMARLVGMDTFANSLEAICFKHLEPELMSVIYNVLEQNHAQRQETARSWQAVVSKTCAQLDVRTTITLLDNQHAITQQFFKQKDAIDTLLSTFAIEIATDNIDTCYLIANALKAEFICFDEVDAIKIPLAGGRQHLKLTLKKWDSTLELTILTHKMQHAANQGVLVLGEKAPETSRSIIRASLTNLEQFLDSDDAKDTVQGIVSHLHQKKIVVYTPSGDPIELPKGASAVDFAYAISPFIGHHAVGARIDNTPCLLEVYLHNGVTVQIITDLQSEPNPDWLNYVTTAKARNHIQKAFAELSPSEQIQAGKDALNRALSLHQHDIRDLSEVDWHDILHWQQLPNVNALYSAIAIGNIRPGFVAARYIASKPNDDNITAMPTEELIEGIHGVEIKYAQCCDPILGDPVLGHLTRAGITVHRVRCPRILSMQRQHPAQVMRLQWNVSTTDDPRFTVHLTIDKILDTIETSEIVSLAQDSKAAVAQLEANDGITTLRLIVRDRNHLAKLLKEIRLLLSFPHVSRLMGANG